MGTRGEPERRPRALTLELIREPEDVAPSTPSPSTSSSMDVGGGGGGGAGGGAIADGSGGAGDGSYHPRHHLIRRLAHSYHGFAHSSAVVPPSHSYVPHHQHHDASATDPHAELGSGGQHWSSERNPLFYPSAAVYHQQQQHEFSAAPPDSHSNVTSAAYVLGAVPANDVHFYRDDAAPIIDHSTGNPHQYDRAVTPEQYESVVTPQQYESVVTSQRYDSRLNSQQYDNTVDSHEYDSTADSQPYDSAVTSPQYDNSSSWHAYPQPFDSYAQRPAIDAKPSSPQPPPIVGDLDHSLLHLEDRAVELIHVTARATDAQIDAILGGADTEDSQVYYTLKNVFEQTRKVYARDDSPFIDPAAIHLDQPGQRETFRKANVATFITIILGEHDGSFVHLNDHFITSFVPLGHRLLKWQGTLLLELKTQVAISALASAADATADPAAILAPLFPPDQHHQIISRHPDAPNLSPDEQEFVDRCAAHKHLLLSQLSTADSHHLLLRQYPWDDFVREFAASIRRNVDSILNDRVMPLAPFSRSTSGLRESPLLQPQPPPPPPLPPSAASSDAATTTATTALMPPPVPLVPSQTDGAVLDGGQEGSETARRSVQRKTWTEPEVKALLEGLTHVHGPHWSRILTLYGRDGSIDTTLRNRTQVDLKDKARNLKLGYQKSGLKLPVALQGVTGDVRKRGGARAKAAMGILDDDGGQLDGGSFAKTTAGAAVGAVATMGTAPNAEDGKKKAKREVGG